MSLQIPSGWHLLTYSNAKLQHQKADVNIPHPT